MTEKTSPVAADAFRWAGGLGKTGWRIWNALRQGVITEAALRDRLGVHPRTVRRNLAKLADAGLADRAGENQWQAIEGDLCVVAEVLGTLGRSAAQRDQHEVERESYRRGLTMRERRERRSGRGRSSENPSQ